MVQQVDVDGAIHEFPDEATPAMMRAALKGEAARQTFNNISHDGILERPIERSGADLWNMAKGIGNSVIQGVPSTINQLINEPGRAGKNIVAGVGGIPLNIANAIMNIPQYVTHLESNTASNALKKYTPQIPTEKMQENFVGGTPTQEDTDIRSLMGNLPILGPLGKAGAATAARSVTGGLSKVVGKTDKALEANEALLGNQAESKAAEVDQKTAAAQAADEANKQAIAQSKQAVGKSDADLMQYNVNNREKTVNDLTSQNAALGNQLNQIKPEEGAVSGAAANVDAATDAKLKAQQEVEANDAAYSAAIEQSKQATGKSNPDLMQNVAQKRQENIANLTDQANDLQKQLAETKVEEGAVPKAQENLETAQNTQNNTESMANNIDSNIGQFLNQGAAHDVRAAQGLTHRVQDIENYWNDSYKKFQSNIADANFQMPKTAMEKLDYDAMSPTQLVKTFGADAFEALKKGKMDEFIQKQKTSDVNQAQGNNPYLNTLMEVAPTITDTNAADFLAKYKDFRDRTFKLSKRLRDPRVEEVEKQKMQEALTQARQMQGKMKEVLDAGLGEYKPEFERLNKGYSEQIYPLRDNPVVQNAQEGKLSDNIIKSLRTNEEGMPLVRELVKQDPEILRNVVGQRYFSKPDEVNNPNELMREYLGEMPELKQLLNEKQNANSALEQSRANTKLAQQQHADIVKRQTESQKLESNLSDLHDKIKGSEKELSTLEKHISSLRDAAKNKNISLEKKVKIEKQLADAKAQHADLQKKQTDAEKIEKKMNDLSDDISKHASEIPKLKEHIKNLQETAQRKNLSLKDKIQTEKELKELRRQLKDTSTKLDQSTTGLRKYWRIAKTVYKIGRKIT